MITPKFWYKDNSTLKYVLYPLTSLWLLGSYVKQAYVKPKKFSIPIICVGNIIAGGSGKTPLTMQLAKLFLKKNYVVHIIKKQYKSKNTQIVTLVNEKSDPRVVGDEPILISKIASTWLVKERKIGIEHAIKKGANLIILDDGYQDYTIMKDFNILTINERQQFGNKNIIPAGPLREKIYKGIKKADSIFFYGKKKSLDPAISNSSKPITFVKTLYDKNFIKNIKNKNILAFTGIAHPENFFNSIINYGFNLIKKFEFSDHYRYTKKDFEKIILISEKLKLLVITTEKDYVKVPKKFKNKILPIPLIIQFNQEAFYNLFIQKVKKNVNRSI